jgi:hypothetical protein
MTLHTSNIENINPSVEFQPTIKTAFDLETEQDVERFEKEIQQFLRRVEG